MRLARTSKILKAAALSAALCILYLMGAWSLRGRTALAQSASAIPPAMDSYQRSSDIFTYSTAAKSGHLRGEEIYLFKCWICHNQFAKTGPPLGDLYKRGTFMMTAKPVNDQALAEKIRQGGPGMPSFGTTLADADIADLISYFKSGRCCNIWENPPPNPWYRGGNLSGAVGAVHALPLHGGARGFVHTSTGEPIEGVGVQLISSKTAIRTTVYTNPHGRYEFPQLESGQYTLRIARPHEYQPYVKQAVEISGATPLNAIVLRRVSESEFLPPTPFILSQLSGSEWMLNLPGTGQEKRIFTLTCGFGCHSYQQIFRNRYDERSWRIILQRMFQGGGSPLIVMRPLTPHSRDRAGRPTAQDEDLLAKWLSTVRGPHSKMAPLYYLPRPTGESTRVIITEYELPRTLLSAHDVCGDAMGRIWYTSQRTPYSGMLNPLNGKVTEYHIPPKDQETPGVLPGIQHCVVDKNGIVWFSEIWGHYLTALDPKTGKILHRFKLDSTPPNLPMFGNFAMDDAGYVYDSRGRGVRKIDSRTGKVVQEWPYKKTHNTYDTIVTPDGRYWAGAQGGTRLVAVLDTKTGQMTDIETPGMEISAGARGGFDPDENAWFGGRGGMLIKVDPRSHRAWTYQAPVPYETFYEAMPDKNGEIWAGGLQSGMFMRFQPKTGKWIEYFMPEPYAHDRRTWIDNSTNPVTVWYVDNEGYLVRIQPLE